MSSQSSEPDHINRQLAVLSANLQRERVSFPYPLERPVTQPLHGTFSPRAQLYFPGNIVHDTKRIIYHPAAYEREFKYLAYFIEHDLGWTLRLDKSHIVRASEPFSVGSVVEAMMPNLNYTQWSLPRLEHIPLDKFPVLSFENEYDIYHVAWIVQPKSVKRGEFVSDGIRSFYDSHPVPSNAMYESKSMYVFLSELAKTEWNDQGLVMGEAVDPMVLAMVNRFCSMYSMPFPTLPMVLYHGTLEDRAISISRDGFAIYDTCKSTRDLSVCNKSDCI